jgi:hypothetical protein
LQQIECNHGVAKSRLLALSLRALVRQALGFALGEDELSRLVAYVANGEWRGHSSLLERADREFEGRQEEYVRLLSEEIGLFLNPEARSRLGDAMLADGALLLSQSTRSASNPVRWRILSSQLHMTWNRMGIRNLEEVYLGRILWRAVRHLVDTDNGLGPSLAEALTQPKIRCKGGFDWRAPYAKGERMSNQSHVVGSCACGAIKFVFTLPIRWCTHCHCYSCRRHHGAAVVTWIGVASDAFRLSGREHLKWHLSSEDSKRGFCVHCGSPLLFMSERWPDEVHVVRASLHGDLEITPGAHAFFDQHVSWFPFEDSLPRLGGKHGIEPMDDSRQEKP